jgi:Flp pilus assembly protein TadD/polyferredoxin
MQAIPLPQLSPDHADDGSPPRRRYVRWRVATLIGVHLLAALHIAHWRLAGRTLAPLELNEVMHTLELGIITAGFVLMALIVVSVMIFGRFFCSWGCHILALQDLCAWLLGKLRIRAKPVRSRLLLLVAPGAMLYMFVWPQARRLIEGRALPTLHLRDDTGGWASFVTDDFWRNLPGPGVALLTFAVCGFAIVYVLGTRSFCQYACPYGAIFGIMDRVAPGRIKVDPAKCTSCGVCTGVCDSHVRVHEEIARHGSVVDPSCLKDLDCVTACPEQALSYGWTRPSLLRSLRPARRRLRYDFTWGEELLIAAVFVGSLAIFRGLYGIVPFLLALAVGAILAYGAVVLLRLRRRENVRLNGHQLKLKGRITRPGIVYTVLAIALATFAAHSGVIRYHEVRARRALTAATTTFEHGGDPAAIRAASRDALRSLSLCAGWSPLTAPDHERRVASASWGVGDVAGAEHAWRRAIERSPRDLASRMDLAASLLQRGRIDAAEPLLRELCAVPPRSGDDSRLHAAARSNLGFIAERRGRLEEAIDWYRAAARLRPDDPGAWSTLARAQLRDGRIPEARASLERALRASPTNAEAHFDLGRLLVESGDGDEGLAHLRRAAELDPRFRRRPDRE